MYSYEYPKLHKVFDLYRDLPPQIPEFHLVACQHLLETQLEMFKLLISYGFKPQNMHVLGKIYSTNTEILGELKDLGIQMYQPALSLEGFDLQHRANCLYMLDSVPEGQKIIVLDDGGELLSVFNESDRATDVLAGIEQTSSGFRKLEKTTLNFPVFNVARSHIKLTLESKIIADLCTSRIKECIEIHNIEEPQILVVGLGPIGENVRRLLKESYSVQGFDSSLGHTDLIKTIIDTKPNIIVGATGFPIMTSEDIERFANHTPLYLISVSSSDREFPVSFFRNGSTSLHADMKYKNITFVNNGFPITFKGNRIESPLEGMENTMGLLLGSTLEAITKTPMTIGFINVPQGVIDILL
jgi:hypothetical protein